VGETAAASRLSAVARNRIGALQNQRSAASRYRWQAALRLIKTALLRKAAMLQQRKYHRSSAKRAAAARRSNVSAHGWRMAAAAS